LKPLLDAESVPGTAWAIFVIGKRREPFDIVRFLGSAHAEVRFRAAEAAGEGEGRLGDRERAVLVARLEDPEPMVRVAAAWALARKSDEPGALLTLVTALGPAFEAPVARDASLRLAALAGPLVSYDANRGYRHREEGRRSWARALRRKTRRDDLLRFLDADPDPPAVARLRGILDAAPRPIDRRAALDLWREASGVDARNAAVAEARADVLRTALDHLPDEGMLRAEYAYALLHTGRLDEAAYHYSAAALAEPDHAMLHNNYGIVLEALERYPDAEEEFRTAVRLDPTLEAAWVNLAHSFVMQGRADEAVTPLLLAESRNPGGWTSHRLLLGRILANPLVAAAAERRFRID
jgi:tetratricopeptide (TPR) repeat protein